LQQYKQPADIVRPGSRVAVNLSGVSKDDLSRGQVLSHPGRQRISYLIDVHYTHLADASHPLTHNAAVKVFVGSAETTAHVRLLDAETIAPGAEGWLQLRLDAPLAVERGDRFILRRASPSETIGGGIVADAAPARRWRRFRLEIIQQLETRLSGTPAERIAQLASGDEPVKRSLLAQSSGLNAEAFQTALDDALASQQLTAFPGDAFWSTTRVRAVLSELTEELAAFHRVNPLRLGMPREAARSRIGVKQAIFAALLDSSSEIAADGQILRLNTHQIRFTPAQQQRIDHLHVVINDAPYTPPSYTEAAQLIGEDVLAALLDLGELVRVQADIIFPRAAFDTMLNGTLALIDEHGSVTAAMLRDTFGTSRKYAIGLLEYLDALGVTKRVGDARVRK
jgi:selenocysteine-specific elongation factor